ncbi:tRNA (guanosine(37)-N1)-methyltransferase TrmD [Alienimonas sp. DA493]|uniref:tRNA (guanosine(37)-N1)-methyltransferase TrmD n=1 Tax=Alienimonas sp. DA493 TaxID=3373605 RepID=UPI0037540976
MRFDVCTLFPGLFDGFLSESLVAKAIDRGLIDVRLWNYRDRTLDKHHRVDDSPYGGGPGMLLACQPVFHTVEAVRCEQAETPGELLMLTPTGERLTQPLVEELATKPRLILLCGRYEGFDHRVKVGLQPREISVGDFVLNGGEVPAMLLIEACMRLIPGVLGDADSARYDSHSAPGRLEFPQYTRPRDFRGLTVPDVLLSGDHAKIAAWREQQSDARSAGREL